MCYETKIFKVSKYIELEQDQEGTNVSDGKTYLKMKIQNFNLDTKEEEEDNLLLENNEEMILCEYSDDNN